MCKKFLYYTTMDINGTVCYLENLSKEDTLTLKVMVTRVSSNPLQCRNTPYETRWQNGRSSGSNSEDKGHVGELDC